MTHSARYVTTAALAGVLAFGAGGFAIDTALAANAAPSAVASCASNWGAGFSLTFDSSASGWVTAITGVTVNGDSYTLDNNRNSVRATTTFYAGSDYFDGNYLLIGEGAVNGPTTCTVAAAGYDDLTLILDNTGGQYTATVSSSVAHEHSGGEPTCETQAECVECGQAYGEFAAHTYENGFCTVCGDPDPDYVPEVVLAAPTASFDTSDSTYVALNFAGDGAAAYVANITELLRNGEALTPTDYKIGLLTGQYYLDDASGTVYLNKMGGTPFTSGDVVTVLSTGYADQQFKVTVGANGAMTLEYPDADGNYAQEGDNLKLHVRLEGTFEAAVIGQTGYDAISGASTSVSQNKNSDVVVKVALVEKDVEPADDDWQLLSESGIATSCTVNLDAASGMAGRYSPYDGSVTLDGTPAAAGSYLVSVTIVDDQGRKATSNELPFVVYSGSELLESQLVVGNFVQTADGKYMYTMEPWTIADFTGEDGNQTVTVPADLKAWYGSHTSGTYGKLGYAVAEGADATQTLVVPAGCNLTLVNMDVLSSVNIVVEDGGTLVLNDSVVQGRVDVQSGGSFSMNYSSYDGAFSSGASVNGQVVLHDGAVLGSALVYSNSNFIANGDAARHTTAPVMVIDGDVTLTGTVYIRGDEAATGTDASTGLSYAGQAGLAVTNGATLTLAEGAVLAVYGGGSLATTSNGGAAVVLDGGTITGPGTLVAVGGSGFFGNGANAVAGTGTVSVANAYLEGGNSVKPASGAGVGQALGEGVTLADATNRVLVAGTLDKVEKGSYWSGTTAPDVSALIAAIPQNGTSGENTGEGENGGAENGGERTVSYTVTYNAGAGSFGDGASKREVTVEGSTVTLTFTVPDEVPSLGDGYEFACWRVVVDEDAQSLARSAADGTYQPGDEVDAAGNMELTAVYTLKAADGEQGGNGTGNDEAGEGNGGAGNGAAGDIDGSAGEGDGGTTEGDGNQSEQPAAGNGTGTTGGNETYGAAGEGATGGNETGSVAGSAANTQPESSPTANGADGAAAAGTQGTAGAQGGAAGAVGAQAGAQDGVQNSPNVSAKGAQLVKTADETPSALPLVLAGLGELVLAVGLLARRLVRGQR